MKLFEIYFSDFYFRLSLSTILTGAGKLMYLITNAAMTNAASRPTMSKVSGRGIRCCQVRETNRVAISTLSANGSRKEPIVVDCPSQFLAIQPSSCWKKIHDDSALNSK